jgi:hypothetical protein
MSNIHKLKIEYRSPKAEAKAQREWEAQRRVEDLRDNTIAIVLDGIDTTDKRSVHRRFQEVELAYGASVATLYKWLHKEVAAPKLTTIRATLRACGRDLGIMEGNRIR